MTPVTSFDNAPTPKTPSRGFDTVPRLLPPLLLLLAACGLAATTMFDIGADASADTVSPRLAAAPAAMPPLPPLPPLPPVATIGNTTVPDASAVFRDREIEVEEPVPTF